MTRRRYGPGATPDAGGVVDIDRGSSAEMLRKQAEVVPDVDYAEREATRSSARGLDDTTEGMRLTRAGKDLNRAYPRATTAPIGNERKRRTLPAEIEVRRAPSERQHRARTATVNAVFDRMPRTQHAALSGLVQDPQRWADTNDALSEVNGDAVMLDDDRRREVQRVDRAIQSYERQSGRGHVVYTVVALPYGAVRPDHLPSTLAPGEVVSLDRFTNATHSMGDLAHMNTLNDVVFEIETTRGMFLGHTPDGASATSHLLPRGLQLEVVGSHVAPYVPAEGGRVRHRLVVQLRDHDR